MSNNYSNDSRRRPPLDKYGTPGTQYPTPNPYDVVITEDVTNRTAAYEPVLYGTPHPSVAAAILCYQGQIKGNNSDKAALRIYANPRLAQEPYNLVNGDDEANDPAFPVYVRSYLLPRGFTKATMGSALTALIGLSLGAGGSGYGDALFTPGFGKLPLSFSGGTGSGAAGFAEIAAGVVVAVVLTNTGTGYTSAPSVSIGGGGSGSGAGITGLLQPTTAKLTNEEEQAAEEPFGGYFVRVTRSWETIPGPTLVSTKYDPESDVLITTARTKKLLSAITPAFTISGSSAKITEKEPIDALFGWETVTTIPQSIHHDEASAIVEEEMLPFQFPGRINIRSLDIYGTAIGQKTPSSDTVLHTTRTWWVVDSTKPTLDYDEMSPDDIVINNVSYRRVLHNSATRGYGGLAVVIPATTPNYSDYSGVTEVQLDGTTTSPSGTPWVGSARIIRGSITRAGHANRWRVQATSVIMR